MFEIERALAGESSLNLEDLRIRLFLILFSEPDKSFTLDELKEKLGVSRMKIRDAFSILFRLELATFDFYSQTYRLRDSRNSIILKQNLYPKQQI